VDNVDVILGLVGILYLAIIGVYVWTYKVSRDLTSRLGEIYETVNGHIQKADIHTNKSELVQANVHKVIYENLSNDISEIKGDVKSLLGRVQN